MRNLNKPQEKAEEGPADESGKDSDSENESSKAVASEKHSAETEKADASDVETTASGAAGSVQADPTPSIADGEKLDAGISYDDALLRKEV